MDEGDLFEDHVDAWIPILESILPEITANNIRPIKSVYTLYDELCEAYLLI
jgi:hypothetical protein